MIVPLSQDLQRVLQGRLDAAIDELRAVAREACQLRPDGRMRKKAITNSVEYLCQQIEGAISDERDARHDREGKIERIQEATDQAIALITDLGRDQVAGRRARRDLDLARKEADLDQIEEALAAEVDRAPKFGRA